MLLNNKKALSEIVGYSILIVIAITLSIMVYAFLKSYIPGGAVSCEEDLNLIVQNYSCQGNNLDIGLLNKGLFKVDGVYIRFGEPSKSKGKPINEDDILLYNPDTNDPGLNPGKSYFTTYSIDRTASTQYELELEPAIIRNKKLVFCSNSIITQPIKCS